MKMPKPSCEVKFDHNTGKLGQIHFYNLRSDDREERERVAATRVEQITKQLNCPHGLTNNERRLLSKERDALQRAFLGGAADDKVKKAKQQKILKAAEKKLRRRVRKADRERGIDAAV
jgi:hypothetical protein